MWEKTLTNCNLWFRALLWEEEMNRCIYTKCRCELKQQLSSRLVSTSYNVSRQFQEAWIYGPVYGRKLCWCSILVPVDLEKSSCCGCRFIGISTKQSYGKLYKYIKRFYVEKILHLCLQDIWFRDRAIENTDCSHGNYRKFFKLLQNKIIINWILE